MLFVFIHVTYSRGPLLRNLDVGRGSNLSGSEMIELCFFHSDILLVKGVINMSLILTFLKLLSYSMMICTS